MSTPAVKALASQVGGHAGVMSTEDGSLLIKPATKRELEFYQRLQSSSDVAIATLREYTPKFFGTLTLEGETAGATEAGELQIQPVADRKDKFIKRRLLCEVGSDETRLIQSLVLENLSHGFLKPNILDIKLGTVLYDETANEEKVARMIETAKNTTSFETGVRLTGFQVGVEAHFSRPNR